ncbi:hypothetical protein ACSRBA_22900, partial [Salmonella enterica]
MTTKPIIRNFAELVEYTTETMLTLDLPEVYDPSVSLSVDQNVDYDYIGVVTGKSNVTNPTNHKVVMYAYPTGEYLLGE